jgi:nucleoid DNA-binding protein
MSGINEISRLTGLNREQVTDVFDAIVNLTKHGQRVIIRGFGSFFTREIKARTIKSSALPKGEAKIPEQLVLRFRPAKELRVVVTARGQAKRKSATK